MKKLSIYILQFIYFLFLAVEFLWSVVVVVFESIGGKLNELTDSVESKIEKLRA